MLAWVSAGYVRLFAGCIRPSEELHRSGEHLEIPIQTFILPYHCGKGGQASVAIIAGSLDTIAGRVGANPRTAPQSKSNIGNVWGTLPQSITFAKPPRTPSNVSDNPLGWGTPPLEAPTVYATALLIPYPERGHSAGASSENTPIWTKVLIYFAFQA